MRAFLPVLALFPLVVSSVQAGGLLIPQDKTVPPLAMLRHQVTVAIEDQAAVTRVEQTFRNHTGRKLEATYVFPVPRGGSVHGFSMWLDGKEVKGELVEAGRARAIYSEAVQRTLDPGLLEYLGNNLFHLHVLVPAGKDLKIALNFTSELNREGGVIEYLYPLKTDGKAAATLEQFTLDITLKSRHGVQNIYSPSHAVAVRRVNNREARVVFNDKQGLLNRDFQLLFTLGEKDVGVTLLAHKPAGAAKGTFMLLLSPKAELLKDRVQPRDLVLVLDISGSMAGTSIRQARNALKYVLDRLGPRDRFGLVTFADTVNTYGSGLWDAGGDNVARAKNWLDGLQAVGGTNINDALLAALDLRPAEKDRSFTIIFFTDGQPTTGITKPGQIVNNFLARNTANTRLFTFGVGHDVNATLLDRLALRSRAASAYVRPQEDIEARVSSLFAKIQHPVLVNLKLAVSKEVVLEDMMPGKLPDLFHGGQVMVLGKYTGHGKVKLTLEGTVGKQKRLFEYTVDFPDKTNKERAMVETIWARRKVGSLIDQVRAGGENKELVDSIVFLGKTYGIATPYTSYLIVPEMPLPAVDFGPGAPSASPAKAGGKFQGFPPPLQYPPVFIPNSPYGSFQGSWGTGFGSQWGNPFGSMTGGYAMMGGGMGGMSGMMGAGGMGMGGSMMGMMGGGMMGGYGMIGSGMNGMRMGGGRGGMVPAGGTVSVAALFPKGKKMTVADLARLVQSKPGTLSDQRGKILTDLSNKSATVSLALKEKNTLDQARLALAGKQHARTQTGQLGVDLSVQSNQLRNQMRLARSASKKVAGRSLLEIAGVWIDEGFDPKMPTVVIKAFSPAYFRLLDRRPELRELFQLGHALVWVSPAGTALIIDPDNGRETWNEAVLAKLFPDKKGT